MSDPSRLLTSLCFHAVIYAKASIWQKDPALKRSRHNSSRCAVERGRLFHELTPSSIRASPIIGPMLFMPAVRKVFEFRTFRFSSPCRGALCRLITSGGAPIVLTRSRRAMYSWRTYTIPPVPILYLYSAFGLGDSRFKVAFSSEITRASKYLAVTNCFNSVSTLSGCKVCSDDSQHCLSRARTVNHSSSFL